MRWIKRAHLLHEILDQCKQLEQAVDTSKGGRWLTHHMATLTKVDTMSFLSIT